MANCRRRFNNSNLFNMNTISTQNINTVENPCNCGFNDTNNTFPTNPQLGQSYTPYQTLNEVFAPETALFMGTIFPELVSTYTPCQSMENSIYLRSTNSIKGGCNDV